MTTLVKIDNLMLLWGLTETKGKIDCPRLNISQQIDKVRELDYNIWPYLLIQVVDKMGQGVKVSKVTHLVLP